MNIFNMCSNLFAIIRSNVKAMTINALNSGRFSCHPFVRLQSDVRVALDTHSRMCIGKGVLIASNSVISATDGGKLSLGKMVGINRNSMIMCHDKVCIGDNTIMGPGVYIYDHDHVFDSTDGVRRNEYVTAPITIGKNCWIGANTVILRGTTIGDNCLIAAGCVVKGNYPDGSVVIQKREEIIKRK